MSSQYQEPTPRRGIRPGHGSFVARAWLATLVLVILGLLLPRPAGGAVAASPAERLQALTRLPQVSFSTGITFDPLHGYVLLRAGGGRLTEVEDLRKALTGDAADAPRYARLAAVLGELGEDSLAARARGQAIALYRQQGAGESLEPGPAAAFARVLIDDGQREEAERVLRRVAEAAASDWRCRSLLARLLALQALRALLPVEATGPELPLLSRILDDPERRHLNPAGAEPARRLLVEATRLATRAVDLAPSEPEPLLAANAAATSRRFVEVLLSTPPAGDEGLVAASRALFHAEALPDLRKAARLKPQDPELWGVLAMLEVLSEAFLRGLRDAGELITREVWSGLPDGARKAVREAMTRLETIGQGADPRVSSDGLATLGLFQFFVIRDTAGGVATLRQATARDPANGDAWETLTFALAFSKQFDALLEVCQDRVKHQDNLRSRILLAKAFEKTGRLEEMYAEVAGAQRRHAESLLGNLALGAALLKVDRTEAGRARALQFIAKATRLAGDQATGDPMIEVLFQRGLFFALTGQHAVARAEFQRLLNLAPGHPDATEALQALGQIGD